MSVASCEVSLGPMVILHSDAAAGASAVLTPQQQSILAERIRSGETSAEEELDRLFRRRVLFLVLARTRDAKRHATSRRM